ncbi:hypothetical protein LJC55_02290 [Eubacteriales bacterium OttesenSCG-928-N14]|nr:hypothetical protein [Eubacteriales bacterium OttesenSCG-928-N14]
MLQKSVRIWGEEQGFTIGTNSIYTVYEDIPFTIYRQEPYGKWALAAYLGSLNPWYLQNMQQQLSQFGASFHLSEMCAEDGYLILSLSRKTKQSMQAANSFIRWIIDYIHTQQQTLEPVCAICGEPCFGILYDVGGLAGYAHDDCIYRAIADNLPQMNPQKTSSRYLEGFTGALAGATLGQIIYLIASLFFDFHYGVLMVLVCFLTLKGYDLLQGEQGRGKKWILCGCILFTTAFFSVITYIAAYALQTGTLSPRLVYLLFNSQAHMQQYVDNFTWIITSALILSMLIFISQFLVERGDRGRNQKKNKYSPQ